MDTQYVFMIQRVLLLVPNHFPKMVSQNATAVLASGWNLLQPQPTSVPNLTATFCPRSSRCFRSDALARVPIAPLGLSESAAVVVWELSTSRPMAGYFPRMWFSRILERSSFFESEALSRGGRMCLTPSGQDDLTPPQLRSRLGGVRRTWRNMDNLPCKRLLRSL